MFYFSVTTDSPNYSVGLVLPELSFTPSIIPLVQVLSATTLGVPSSALGLDVCSPKGFLQSLEEWLTSAP